MGDSQRHPLAAYSQEEKQYDELTQFLDVEWEALARLKEELLSDKIIIRKAFACLNEQKEKLKRFSSIIEEQLPDGGVAEETLSRLSKMKAKLSRLSEIFNKDVAMTRDNQVNLQAREASLN